MTRVVAAPWYPGAAGFFLSRGFLSYQTGDSRLLGARSPIVPFRFMVPPYALTTCAGVSVGLGNTVNFGC